MISLHDLVTVCLVYLIIGSLIWLVLDGLGIIGNTFVERPSASFRSLVLASAMMILGWPVFVLSWVMGMLRGQVR